MPDPRAAKRQPAGGSFGVREPPGTGRGATVAGEGSARGQGFDTEGRCPRNTLGRGDGACLRLDGDRAAGGGRRTGIARGARRIRPKRIRLRSRHRRGHHRPKCGRTAPDRQCHQGRHRAGGRRPSGPGRRDHDCWFRHGGAGLFGDGPPAGRYADRGATADWPACRVRRRCRLGIRPHRRHRAGRER